MQDEIIEEIIADKQILSVCKRKVALAYNGAGVVAVAIINR